MKKTGTILLFVLLLAANCLAQPAGWNVTPTGANHTIFFNATVVPVFNGQPLEKGDAIGVFYDSAGVRKCGGVSLWDGTSTYITVYGKSGSSAGFATGETFVFKLWKSNTGCISDSVSVAFTEPDNVLITATDKFLDGGLSEINQLTAKPNGRISYTKNVFCQNESNPKPSVYGISADVIYTASSGLSVNSITGEINLSQSKPGSYRIGFTTVSCLYSTGIDITIASSPTKPNLGTDISLCPGSSSVLGGDFSNTLAYNWSTKDSVNQITVNNSGSYWVMITDKNGCIASDTVKVTVLDIIKPDLGADILLCSGSSATLGQGISGNASYNWSTNASSSQLVVTGPGIYWVKTVGQNGCIGTDTVVVSASLIKANDFSVQVTNGDCQKPSKITISTNASGASISTYELYNNISNSVNSSISGEFYETEGTFLIVVKGTDGCNLTLKNPIKISKPNNCNNVILVPAGYNGYVNSSLSSTDQALQQVNIPFDGTIKIYDRNGKIIRKLQSPAYWDGLDESGTFVPMGDYYIVDENGKNFIVTVLK